MGAAWPNLSHGGGALLLLPGKSSFYELSVSSRLPQYCDESILIEQSAHSFVFRDLLVIKAFKRNITFNCNKT